MGSPDFNQLVREFGARLSRLHVLHRVVQVLGVVMYGLTFLWIVVQLAATFVLPVLGGEAEWVSLYQSGGIFFFMVLFASSYGFSYALRTLTKREATLLEALMRRLFPDMTYSAGGSCDMDLEESSLFSRGKGDWGDKYLSSSFGMLEYEVGGTDLEVYDVGITRMPRQYGVGASGTFSAIWNSTLRPMFAKRKDSGAMLFRGMFGCCSIRKLSFSGRLLILPDRLEGKLGHFAHTLQEFQARGGAKLIQLEDPDFERYFRVYAEDEVAARRVLTPAMMRRMSKLREDFGRDIMFSFSKYNFYYAAAMPEGFLAIRPSVASSAEQLETIFHDVMTAATVVDALKVQ